MPKLVVRLDIDISRLFWHCMLHMAAPQRLRTTTMGQDWDKAFPQKAHSLFHFIFYLLVSIYLFGGQGSSTGWGWVAIHFIKFTPFLTISPTSTVVFHSNSVDARITEKEKFRLQVISEPGIRGSIYNAHFSPSSTPC